MTSAATGYIPASMESSWLSKATSSKLRLPSDSRHELPRWRSPSPMTASMIPPPIVQSMYASTPQALPKSIILEKPSPLHDRQSELEADLQFLLDAQAEGLVRGLEGVAADDQASTGSTTPTAQSVRSASARRRTKPVRRKPGLRSARKGIYNSILALSAVKDEELHAVDAEAREKEAALAQIDEWEQKRAGLQKATQQHADDGEETIRAQRLRQQADTLQEEINNVELQLSDMKARHRKLLRQVTAVENSVQAKMASYTSSLSMLEADVQRFLSVKPAESDARPQSQDGKKSLWQLPPQRRTLDVAREQWTEDREAVLRQRQSIEHEKSALDEGAAVWKDVVAQITDFEKRLRTEMANLSMSSSHSAWEDPAQLQDQDNPERLKALLGNLDTVLEHLETQSKLAEERDWKLLIAAVGAELDALKQGKQILDNVLGSASYPGQNGNGTSELVETEPPTNGSPRAGDDGNEIHELDQSFETARPPRRRIDSDSETDDPDPDLLFSRQDVSDE